ncbi:MAG TPA: hypothetical protein VMU50_06130 [Polyangia bacterium]|nr:hypothetical protein [Polyangia bacterium]
MAAESETRGNNNDREHRSSALKRQVSRIEQDAEDAWSRTRDVFSDISQSLDVKGRVNRHPYGTLAAAVGFGYVLGGGFFTPLTARILRLGFRIGVRLAVLPLLNDEAAGVINNLMGGESSSGGETPRPRGRGQRSNQSGQSQSSEGKVP